MSPMPIVETTDEFGTSSITLVEVIALMQPELCAFRMPQLDILK